ncbi:hypothetical protein DRO91_09165 [Candidatus Heimdallarchaeota archaeon]|nr:MAG: hypothetical protein DRO91_09165 [Candidatus Heimdallarchaeota archaeon]
MNKVGRPQEYNEGRITSVFLEFDILEKLENEAVALRTSRSKLIADIIEWYFKSETERVAKLNLLENKVKELEKKLKEVEKEKESLEKRLNKLLEKEEDPLMKKRPSEMTPEEFAILKERIKKTREKMKARRWL